MCLQKAAGATTIYESVFRQGLEECGGSTGKGGSFDVRRMCGSAGSAARLAHTGCRAPQAAACAHCCAASPLQASSAEEVATAAGEVLDLSSYLAGGVT